MGLHSFQKGIKKRRQERMRLLKEKQLFHEGRKKRTGNQPAPLRYEQNGSKKSWEQKHGAVYIAPFFIKMACTVLLVAGILFVLNSNNPNLHEARQFIHDSMHQDFNLAGIQEWYEQNMASPTFLPQVITNENGQEEAEYITPVASGTVETSLAQDQQGIRVSQVRHLGPARSGAPGILPPRVSDDR
jgi:stage IV sporulation protein FA